MNTTSKLTFAATIALLSASAQAGSSYSGSFLTSSSDEGQHELFADAVEDYGGSGASNLSACIDGNNGFLYYAGLYGMYYNWRAYTNSTAWSTDYEDSGSDNRYNDGGDFSYFSGHGATGLFVFNGSYGDDVVRASETNWGDGDVEVVTIDACQVLNSSGRTQMVNANWNGGVHYINGFESNALDISTTATYYGYYLSVGYTVRSAWVMATRQGHSSSYTGAYIRFTSSSCYTYNDKLWYPASCNPYSSTAYSSTWTL